MGFRGGPRLAVALSKGADSIKNAWHRLRGSLHDLGQSQIGNHAESINRLLCIDRCYHDLEGFDEAASSTSSTLLGYAIRLCLLSLTAL